ncbi:MAG TPA: divalent-cation tolerance protein CutA [Methylococcaceae bacterium]|nr:divalent-cation tolerance protein CutA [Methylococcaceae bacterium]
MTSVHHVILCTFPDVERATQCAQQLVEQQLAACVNLLPTITSIYAWEGRIDKAQEQLLLIKAPAVHYARIEAFIKQHHPYDVPEIIALSIERGLPDYLQWITRSCFVSAY